jgi:hypothetical protein
MSNSYSAPQPVLWPLIVAVMGVFAIFLVIMNLAQTPVTPLAEAMNVPEDQQWRLSSATRQERRAELEGEAQAAASSYGWINKNDGIVRLPVDRAIELTLGEINAGR